MPQLLLERLVKLVRRDYWEDWGRLCHHAHTTEPGVSPEDTARGWLRSYRRRGAMDPMASLETDRLCWRCIQRFADVFRNQMVGRIKGTLEMRPLDPALITAETLRFDPDELVLDGGELIIVDVRVDPAPGEQFESDAPVETTGADGRTRKSPRRKKPPAPSPPAAQRRHRRIRLCPLRASHRNGAGNGRETL
jgi:hypothetical protein